MRVLACPPIAVSRATLGVLILSPGKSSYPDVDYDFTSPRGGLRIFYISRAPIILINHPANKRRGVYSSRLHFSNLPETPCLNNTRFRLAASLWGVLFTHIQPQLREPRTTTFLLHGFLTDFPIFTPFF